MIPTYREDFLEEDELHDDFNSYGLPMRPRIYRGVARPYHPKQRKRRLYRGGGVAPPLRPKRRRPIKVAKNILLPRKKAIKFGEPRRVKLPLRKSPILKVSPPKVLPKNKKKIASNQKASVRSRAKAKALKQEIAQKNEASENKPKMSTKKKLLILGLTITTVGITGYLIYRTQKNKTL